MKYLGVFLLLGLIVFIVIFISYLMERKRSKDLGKIAKQLGLNFFPSDPDKHLRRQFGIFFLFDKGRNRYISNYIEGKRGEGYHIGAFDYTYTIGQGRRARTVQQSVVHFASEQLQTPVFRLHPEGFFQKLNHTLFQKQDIDFSDHPVFSSKYQLTGPDEKSIREYFSEERLSFFATHHDWHIEVFPQRILIYKEGVRLKPALISEFIAQSIEIYQIFVNKANA